MRVRRTRLALSQLDAIQDYIAEDNPVAAFEVTSRIFERVESDLPVYPQMGRVGEHVPGSRETDTGASDNTPQVRAFTL
ncbi:MAG: hypothetical protein GKR94_06480 [Gammaproteobacteria bacterium]|nr:hypothetical protein [Gammaproteobacteria bacterium]